MNEDLIDLAYEEKVPVSSAPQLFVCEGVVSEQKPSSTLISSSSKVTSETQTFDENYLDIAYDEFMQNRFVAIEPTPYTVSQGFFTSYKLYAIMSKKAHESVFEHKVNRRFSDFEWLFNVLINKYPGYIIPELPEKNFLASMNFEKSEFIEARRKDLEGFLSKLLEHKYLRNAEEVRAFILDEEKEFSINKGKSEQKMKGFTVNFTKELANYMGKKGMMLKRQNNEDKDLQNYNVFFIKMRETAQNLSRCIQEMISIREGDLKSLASFEISSIDLVSDGQFAEELNLFTVKKVKNLQKSTSDLESQILSPLKVWIKNSSDVIAALKRREVLDEEVFEDLQRVEEMRRNNIKTNNRRDIEMDLLQTRLDSNQRLLAKTNKTLLLEIGEFKRKSEKELVKILANFDEASAKFFREGGFIY